MEHEDSIEMRPTPQAGEKEAAQEKPKVMMDKSAYDGPQHANPLDNVNPDLHSK